ncbi:SHOCT domain-containing protein [Natrialbaceae archaeon A-arb3/5]
MADDTTLLRTVLFIAVLVILVPLVLMAVAWPMMGMWGGGHMWNDGAWTGPGMWLVSWVPLLMLLVVGYLVYRAAARSTRAEDDPALEELRLAYARGDISDEEFKQRRERLRRDE